MWIPITSGVQDNKWLNVCRCIDKLGKVNNNKEKQLMILFIYFFDLFVFMLSVCFHSTNVEGELPHNPTE